MSLEESLRDICNNLTSARATERKKSADALKDFLTRNAVPSLLNENSYKKSGFTWNNVFDDINDYVLKEIEKLEHAKNFHSVTGPLCKSLLHLCVAGSNKGNTYIKCEKLIDACLHVLNNKRSTSAVGDAYLSLLYKYVFPVEYYLGYISPISWENLLDVCISTFLTNISQLDDIVKIRLIFYVVKNATSFCQFVVPLRDSLPKLRKCFDKAGNDKKVQEFIMEIIIVIIKSLGPECRLTMCEFTEGVLPNILKFYEQSLDLKKKTLLFRLFELTIVLHHPIINDDSSKSNLAHIWEDWNRYLQSMLEIVSLEINYVQKFRIHKDNFSVQCSSFSFVSASAYYQVFKMQRQSNEDVGNVAKKQRTTFNKNRSFNDLIQEFHNNHVSWIGVIKMYVKHYSHTLSSADYLALINTSETVISNNIKEFNWNAFEELQNLILNRVADIYCDNADIRNAILNLWNACVRNVSISNDAQKGIFAILQLLLKLGLFKYKIVQPLILLYLEKGMLVNDYSLKTLSIILNKFYSKCCYLDIRNKCVTLITKRKFAECGKTIIKDILLRFLCKDNIYLISNDDVNSTFDNKYNVILTSNEKIFDYDLDKSPNKILEEPIENIEINPEMNEIILKFLERILSADIIQLDSGEIDLIQYTKTLNVILIYFDTILSYNLKCMDEVTIMPLFYTLQSALKRLYAAVTKLLKTDVLIRDKVNILKCLQDFLIYEYHPLLCIEIRKYIEDNYFHCVHNILKNDTVIEDAEIDCEDDLELNMTGLKHNCIYVLAAYCRKHCAYTDELNKCILDGDLYNFNSPWDVECAYKCIKLLNDPIVERRPIELIFNLMRKMCRELFRNCKATHGLLQILTTMIKQIWSHGANILRHNCIIMVKSYLQRCTKMFYPPHVAALVYECVAKILQLSFNENYDLSNSFKAVLLENIKCNVHSIRMYSCNLLGYIAKEFSEDDIDSLVENITDLFIINVSEENETVLKDELSNRTLTALYSLFVIGLNKKSFINKTIIKLLHINSDKKMDGHLVKSVLNKLTQLVASTEVEVYLNENILHILYYWFNKRKRFLDLPVSLFGFDSLDQFVDKHMSSLIPCEILWTHSGNIEHSKVLLHVQTRSGKSKEDIMEMCFCNIIILCLPHIVTDKYKLNNEREMKFKSLEKANRMFQLTRHILKNERWSNLFVENLGQLLLLSATHTRDHCGALEVFGLPIVDDSNSDYTFSKDVFLAILRYFGELIDGDILQYLCENQPLVLLNILHNLWNGVANEKITEFKIVSLHTFITFAESIPLGFSSDALLFNFVCTSFMNAIKHSKTKEDIQMFAKGMKILMIKILNHSRKDLNFLRKSILSETVSILTIKKEEGFETTCDSLLTFLITDMKEYFTQDVDVVDYIHLMCNKKETSTQISKREFSDKLYTFISSLPNASHEILSNMCNFVRQNRQFVKQLSKELSVKGFSDECGKSLIHQAILFLSKTLKTTSNEKLIIEACNCMAEIGIYDLKTFVTAPPPDTHKIVKIHPKQYFAISVLSTLSQYLLDADWNVSNKVAKAINRVLKFRDGKAALELFDLDKRTLICLSPGDCEIYAEYKIDSEKFNLHTTSGYWVPNRGEDHSQWITRITVSLLDVIIDPSRNFTNGLKAVCSIQPSICTKILPSLIGLLLESSSEIQTQAFSDQINQVFKYIWEASFQENIENSDDSNNTKLSQIIDHDHKLIIHYLLDVVNFVRIQRHHYTLRSREQNALNYLRLEYDRVAWAATVAEHHVAGVYYGELWAAARADGVPPDSPQATTALPGGEHVQTIFRRCFVSLGEMDAIDGCGTAHLTSEEEKRKHLISSGQFADALLLHDIALSRGNLEHDLQYGAVTSLHKSGMHHLALQYIKSFPENDDLNDIKYECLSYLGDWSDFVDIRELEEKSRKNIGYPKSIINSMRYACLKDCLTIAPSKEFDTKLIKPLNRAKLATARLCQNLNMENCQNVYKIVANLHLFRDIEDYLSVRSGKTLVSEIISAWSVDMLPPFNDFKYLETLISQRSLILEHAAKNYAAHVTGITELQLQYAELGLSNRRIQMAQRIVAALKTNKEIEKVTLLESQISWAKGHKDIALSLLNGIVSKQTEDIKWAAMSLRQYGLWMAECKRENGRDIINGYLEKSMNMLSGNGNVEIRLKVFYDIAKFADEEYKQVVIYMNSSAFENKIKCMEDMKGMAASLKSSQQSLTKDEKKAMITNNAFQQLDQAEIAHLKAEKDSFLKLAMRYYLLSLAQSEENNLSVFRVISLWFDNPNIDLDDESSGKLSQLLNAIPSWKFITVLPQLAPRISNENDQLSDLLKKLILRCAMEHPHHTLPILFNLKNSEKDKCMRNMGRGLGAGASARDGGARASGASGACARADAAAALLAQVGAPTTPLATIVAQMELVCDATIRFAYCVPKSKDLRPQAIPKTEPISKLRNLDCVPIPTDTIAIQKNCDYSLIHTLTGFDNYFELVGGINYPKKISCLSSDGKKRILLVKGEDDLRQDAVMQQVFNIVNTLLEKNPITYRSKLSIRTYKVVAMSRRSGVLEWCEGTMPIGAYLLAAHTKYRPQDISPSSARTKLKECHDNRRSNKYKLEVFNDILKVFKPVFHYFFTENYLDPVTWFERRLAYTRSVATSSMVGYIMGLGDRHVQNILIDKKTAEVIHIDFGIAFDQGKTLPTPETIPFRLTQDIVAGFGSSGVEGIFRRCCEKSLQLLRDNQETLLTILEVLLCDPLYLWIVPSTTKSTRCPTEQAGGLAERALLAVRSKLSGAEGGAGGVSVPGHVAGLLHAAAEPANLCRLFPGWQPYL